MIFVACILITSCNPIVTPPDTIPTDDLNKFSSVAEINDFLKEAAMDGADSYYGGSVRLQSKGMMMESAMIDTVSAPTAGASDFSETNVQVKGVDEADFVKNDNKYIYTLTGNKLVIVDAYPAENAKVLSETEVKGSPREMFVNDDRLIVFTSDYDQVYSIQKFDFVPRSRSTSVTKVLVYDISDRKSPELVKTYSISGNYYDSRMIDGFVYAVAKESAYYPLVDMPTVRVSGAKPFKADVYYFPNPESNYNFHTVAAIDLFGDEINAKSFMLGYSNTMFVSKENIYIAYQKNLPYSYYRTSSEDRFFEVVVPLFPTAVRNTINVVKNDDSIDSTRKWEQISTIMEDMYNSMDEKTKEELVEEIADAIEEYEAKLEAERRKTIIHRISIDELDIDHEAKGEVEGYLLNQFSMDEYDSHLRVATTTYIYRRESTMYNNVYVLDSDLDVVGEIEDIAPEEKIYSTRFMGNRLYMVTFKRIDPLFVIDLSDHENPEILGELKIPGYSDYLHPFDENHIIGIGKETEGNEWGGVSTKGVKLSLFDVSDVNNPKQVDKYEIGDSGTDSEALHDHKAFLFDKNKELLVIPVREVTGRYKDPTYGYYRYKTWQGAYALTVTEDGFELRGKVTHSEDEDDDNNYYRTSKNAVRRSLYMDDILYTVSMGKIKMNDIEDLDEINEVELPYEGSNYIQYLY